MVRKTTPWRVQAPCSPHPRGDGPVLALVQEVPLAFSPPAWGWSAFAARDFGPNSVLPTRVGMVRQRYRSIVGSRKVRTNSFPERLSALFAQRHRIARRRALPAQERRPIIVEIAKSSDRIEAGRIDRQRPSVADLKGYA